MSTGSSCCARTGCSAGGGDLRLTWKIFREELPRAFRAQTGRAQQIHGALLGSSPVLPLSLLLAFQGGAQRELAGVKEGARRTAAAAGGRRRDQCLWG